MNNDAGGGSPGIVFAKLEEIHVNDFTFADKCPAIKRITVVRQESMSLFQLLIGQITSLKVRTMFSASDEKELCSLISRMVNLKHLTFITGNSNDEFLIEMLANMTQLESLFIGVESDFKGHHILQWTKKLYANNPELSSLKIETLTDEAFDLFL